MKTKSIFVISMFVVFSLILSGCSSKPANTNDQPPAPEPTSSSAVPDDIANSEEFSTEDTSQEDIAQPSESSTSSGMTYEDVLSYAEGFGFKCNTSEINGNYALHFLLSESDNLIIYHSYTRQFGITLVDEGRTGSHFFHFSRYAGNQEDRMNNYKTISLNEIPEDDLEFIMFLIDTCVNASFDAKVVEGIFIESVSIPMLIVHDMKDSGDDSSQNYNGWELD